MNLSFPLIKSFSSYHFTKLIKSRQRTKVRPRGSDGLPRSSTWTYHPFYFYSSSLSPISDDTRDPGLPHWRS